MDCALHLADFFSGLQRWLEENPTMQKWVEMEGGVVGNATEEPDPDQSRTSSVFPLSDGFVLTVQRSAAPGGFVCTFSLLYKIGSPVSLLAGSDRAPLEEALNGECRGHYGALPLNARSHDLESEKQAFLAAEGERRRIDEQVCPVKNESEGGKPMPQHLGGPLRINGYRVKVNHAAVDRTDAAERIQRITEIILQSNRQ